MRNITPHPSPQGDRESGFVLPLVIGLGLLMTIIGITMVIRGRDDQNNASSQKAAIAALTAAETGINRTLNFLNSNRTIAQYDMESATSIYDWIYFRDNPDVAAAVGTSSCTGGARGAFSIDAFASNEWVDIDPSDSKKGQYKVASYNYSYTPGITASNEQAQEDYTILGYGDLSVQGRINAQSANDSEDKNLGTALTYVQVRIPVTKSPPELVPFPGVFSGSSGLNTKNGFDADVVIAGCLSDSGLEASEINVTGGHEVKEVPSLGLPALPDIPYNKLTATFTGVFPPKNATTVFPRSGDDPEVKSVNGKTTHVYHYYIDTDVDISTGGTEIQVNAKDQVVVFYVNGDLNLGTGSTSFVVEDGSPIVNFQIYGYKKGNGDDDYDGPSNNPPYDGDPQLCMNGASMTTAFVLAPEYFGGVAGGSSDVTLGGAVWLLGWPEGNDSPCGSQTPKNVITQYIDWDDLSTIENIVGSVLVPEGLPPLLNAVVDWKRCDIGGCTD